MSLIDFFIWACSEFNFRKKMSRKFRGFRDIRVLTGALFFGKKFFFVFLRILLSDFSEKSFFTKNSLINEEIMRMNQNFFG